MYPLETSLDPFILNSWPSCNECAAWSSDGEIAIAGGEFVHILTPRQASGPGSGSNSTTIGLRQWHSTRVRTNAFRQREWPHQDAAASHDFSLGEEQSLSTVTALAWSPPGVGPHRRCMLAVLTSNLVLSLWESTDGLEEWKRTAVVNHSLGDHFAELKKAGDDAYRAKGRIRAFAWSAPYHSLEDENGVVLKSKWGAVYLAVANDAGVVAILRVWRTDRQGPGEWDMKVMCQIDLPNVLAAEDVMASASLFQRAMRTKFPVSTLSWSGFGVDSPASFIKVTRRGQCSLIKVQARLLLIESDSDSVLEHYLRFEPVLFEEAGSKFLPAGPWDGSLPGNPHLLEQIEQARTEFDTLHSLDGNSITRVWGFASSTTHDVACITIHPSDMVEYTTPSTVKCTLLFAPKACPMGVTRSSTIPQRSPEKALLEVARWVLGAAGDKPPTISIDRYMLGIFASYSLGFGDESLKREAKLMLRRLRETPESRSEEDESDIDESTSVGSFAASDMETCLICEALIPFATEQPALARCETGHPYTRCHLSLLAIQEPGISKYCSQCDRQFLKPEAIDSGPLQMANGPSLTALLYEEFDVCPYCKAKYRG